jgi:hypothetical protein
MVFLSHSRRILHMWRRVVRYIKEQAVSTAFCWATTCYWLLDWLNLQPEDGCVNLVRSTDAWRVVSISYFLFNGTFLSQVILHRREAWLRGWLIGNVSGHGIFEAFNAASAWNNWGQSQNEYQETNTSLSRVSNQKPLSVFHSTRLQRHLAGLLELLQEAVSCWNWSSRSSDK